MMAGSEMFLLTGTICLCLAMSGVMAQDDSASEPQQYEENRLEIHCVPQRLLAGHTYLKMQEICGDEFNVQAWGLTYDDVVFPVTSFPWTFQMTLVTDLADPLAAISRQFNISERPTRDDITGMIDNYLEEAPALRSFAVPKGKCDNRDGKGVLKLYSGTREYSGEMFFRMLCDFSDNDLKLAVKSVTDNSYVTDMSALAMRTVDVDWRTMRFGDLVTGSSLNDIKVVVEGVVPLLEPMDACIFCIAYFAHNDMKPAGEEHADTAYNGAKISKHFPSITSDDYLIGTPMCLRAGDAGESDLLQILRSSTELITLCGYQKLILEIDPFGTMHNEKNITNNFLSLDFEFQCDVTTWEKPPPNCEMLTNGFGGGYMQAFDTRILFHGSKVDQETSKIHRYTQMFSQDEGTWAPLISSRDDPSGVQKRGFGLLNVYNRFLMSEYTQSTCEGFGQPTVGSSDDAAVAKSIISHIEGLDEENLRAKVDLAELSYPLHEAKMKLSELETTKDYERISNEARELIDQLTHANEGSGIFDHAQYRSLMSAYNVTVKIAESLQSGMVGVDVMRYFANLEMCMISMGLEYLPYILHQLQDPSSVQEGIKSLHDVVGNLTRIVFSARYFYPQFTCLENMLTNLLVFMKKMDTTPTTEEDIEWLFDHDQVRDLKMIGQKLSYNDCGLRLNQCVKKVQTMCNMLEHANYNVQPVAENKDDICVAMHLKQKAEEHYRIIGLLGLKDQMISEHMNDKCRNDPFAPQKGPFIKYKMVNETFGQGLAQVVYKVIPSLDNEYMVWKKESVCTCKKCPQDMDKKKKKKK